MNTIVQSSGGNKVEIRGDRVFINGKDSNFPGSLRGGSSVSVDGKRICVNGLEYVDGEWKKTARSILSR